MKKKAIEKSKSAKPARASRGKAASPAKKKPKPKQKPQAKPKAKASKSGRSKAKAKAKAKPAAQAKAKTPAAKTSRPLKPAKTAKTAQTAKGARAATGPSAASTRAAKSSPDTPAKTKARTRANAKAKAKGGSAEPAAAGDILRKVAPKLREDTGRDTEVTLAPELIAKTLPESVPAEDEGALRNVMSSLSALFGGRDDLSDAELDALLDSKIASGEIPPSAALDPLDEAQSIVYEAWNSEGPQRVRLARKALETSPDCADAYVILAEEDARDKQHALELFRKGVEAGERAIGPDVFRKSAGRFWDVMETRPYMRARLGLAECLWEQGRKEESLAHLRELLRLNPADNQGVRKTLERRLLETGGEPG